MKTQKMAVALLALAVVGFAAAPFASDASGGEKPGQDVERSGHGARQGLVKEADGTLAAFRQADPTLSHFFNGAVGYAVFPSVGKAAVGIGGAYGRGVLFEHGQPSGRASITQVTIGAQLGGQAYSEIVFFENEDAMTRFKKGQLALAAQVSAVVASAGASADAKYAQGVAVFTLPRGGLMAEASIGGQKFGFRPFAKAM